MSYRIIFSGKFRKSLKKYLKYPVEAQKINSTVKLLIGGYQNIPLNMYPHKLKGNYAGCWECHIQPDLLLIWKQFEKPEKEILLVDIGSHSDLF